MLIEYFLPVLIAAAFILAGSIQYFFPPKQINSLYGYRTKRSSLNQQNWEAAQTFSAIRLVASGMLLLLVASVIYYFKMSVNWSVIIALATLLGSIIYVVVSTEKMLKQKTPSD